MELRQLRYFVTVAEELHFGRAAERLRIVQPAVSQQVGRLERELGVRLFDRTSRRVRLTADGMRMLDEARSVLAAADNATAVAAGLSGRLADVIRVGTAPGLDRRLRHALDTLRRDEPGLTIEIDYRPTADQLEALRRGTLDLCLVRGVPSSPGLDTIELWRTPIHVALPAGHPAAAGQDGVRLEQLAGLPARLPVHGCDTLLLDVVLGACRSAGFEPLPGRPAGAVEHTLIEVGSGPATWAALYADLLPDEPVAGVAVRPLDPALTVPGSVVVAASAAPGHVHRLVGVLDEHSDRLA